MPRKMSVIKDDLALSGKRAASLFRISQRQIHKKIDRVFSLLLVVEWLASILCAYFISPRAWGPMDDQPQLHAWAAIFIGGTVISLPLALTYFHPGRTLTRHTIATAQALMSALLIHLCGGRIEAHFHILGSLAFLAFYKDWRVLVTASFFVAADHAFRGAYWPQSVYGVREHAAWHWFEHIGWVLFEDVFLIYSCLQAEKELMETAITRARLEQVNKQLEASNALAQLGVWEVNLKTGMVIRSGVLRRILGVGDEASAQPLRKALESVHPEDLERIQQALAGHKPFSLEHRIMRPDGSERFCESKGRFIHGKDGKPVIIRGTTQDFTERKLAAQRISDQEARIEEASRLSALTRLSALGEMAGGIAHEINTPLTVITLSNSYIAKCMGEENVDRQYVSTLSDAIAKTCTRITKTINSLRSFARDGSRDPMVEAAMGALLDDTLVLCAERFKTRGVRLSVANGFAPHKTIACRPTEITQVLVNLLNNAIDAVEHLPEKWVELAVSEVGDSVRISVTDSGAGIPASVRRKLFQPFFTTKDIGKGTGLGLSISRGIVQSHGGRLSIDDQCPNTRFVIQLPREQGVAHNEQDIAG